MNYAIETDQLTRHFGKTEAVNNLTLRVPEGNIFAFLGPNGAGKTTAIKMLMNILHPTSGSARILGVDSAQLSSTEFSQIGYVSENQQIPEWMTVAKFIAFCKPMYPTWDDALCAKLLKEFDLPLDRKLKSLSQGMKVKATLLVSLAYRPKLIVLDEPFTGLDALVRDEFIRGLLELSEQEKWTIFISSHDIDEVERLADSV
ncbi:MAG: ABC transporter ATP-binding protein, partial [Chthoniobacterales bacterium]